VIDEAVTLAKQYSTREAGRLVNGILDRIYRGLEAPAAKPPAPGRNDGGLEAPAAPGRDDGGLEAPAAKPPAPGRNDGGLEAPAAKPAAPGRRAGEAA
jgi:hypothetical protein